MFVYLFKVAVTPVKLEIRLVMLILLARTHDLVPKLQFLRSSDWLMRSELGYLRVILFQA